MARVPVRATYVEIPVHDIDRAERFYRELLGASTRRLEIDGHPCVLLDEDDATAGAVIALMHGDSYVPSLDGTRVYVTVDDVDATLQRAGELGGATLYPPTEVAEGVTVAELADCEGNRLAISNS